jgi:hypothetical protein
MKPVKVAVQIPSTKTVFECDCCKKQFETQWECRAHETAEAVNGLKTILLANGATLVWANSQEDLNAWVKRYYAEHFNRCKFYAAGWYVFDCEDASLEESGVWCHELSRELVEWEAQLRNTTQAIEQAKKLIEELPAARIEVALTMKGTRKCLRCGSKTLHNGADIVVGACELCLSTMGPRKFA